MSALPALAQIGGNLPLASVGSGLEWVLPDEDYRIVAPPAAAGVPINLEVYSPGLNLNDYVNERAVVGYYGDELYGRGNFATIFTLTSPGGSRLLSRRYENSTAHIWERLIGTPLPTGVYTFKASSIGNGKNAYALRVESPYRIESSQFTVNARGLPNTDLLAARVMVGEELLGKRVEITNYDGDGPGELELVLVTPDGRRQALTVSEDKRSAVNTLSVTRELIGEWLLIARIQPTTRQYSNAFNIRLRGDDKPLFASIPEFTPPQDSRLLDPVLVDVVDPEGRPIPGASYSLSGDTERVAAPALPRGYVPVSASIVEGQGRIVNPTEVRVQPGPATVRFVARPLGGTLSVETVAIFGRQRVPIQGLPVQIGGQNVRSPSDVMLPPGDYRVTPLPVPGSSALSSTASVLDDRKTVLVIEYNVRSSLQLLVSPDAVPSCTTSQFTAMVTTEFPYPLPVTLRLQLPTGISSEAPLETTTQLSSTAAVLLRVPARVCGTGLVRAQLEPLGLTTEALVRVLPPPSLTLVKTFEPGEGTRLVKMLEQSINGYNVTLVLTLAHAVSNLQINEPLPPSNTLVVRGAVTMRLGDGRDSATSTSSTSTSSTGAVAVRVERDVLMLGSLAAGTYTITYPLITDLISDAVGTEPSLNWEDPVR